LAAPDPVEQPFRLHSCGSFTWWLCFSFLHPPQAWCLPSFSFPHYGSKPGNPKSLLCLSCPTISCWCLYLPIRINWGQVPRTYLQTPSCKLFWETQLALECKQLQMPPKYVKCTDKLFMNVISFVKAPPLTLSLTVFFRHLPSPGSTRLSKASLKNCKPCYYPHCPCLFLLPLPSKSCTAKEGNCKAWASTSVDICWVWGIWGTHTHTHTHTHKYTYILLLWEIFSLLRLQRNVIYAKVNDSMTIRDSLSLGGKSVSMSLSKMTNAVTFRIILKAVGRNSENLSSKI